MSMDFTIIQLPQDIIELVVDNEQAWNLYDESSWCFEDFGWEYETRVDWSTVDWAEIKNIFEAWEPGILEQLSEIDCRHLIKAARIAEEESERLIFSVSNGRYIMALDALLCGEPPLKARDFSIKEAVLDSGKSFLMINAFMGRHLVKEDTGLFVSVLHLHQIQPLLSPLLEISDSNLEDRCAINGKRLSDIFSNPSHVSSLLKEDFATFLIDAMENDSGLLFRASY